MSDHNQSSSSDSHNKTSSSNDSWQKLAIPYDEFDVLVSDITEEELVEIGYANEIEHLSPGTFSFPAFPVSGWIHGRNIRYMVPLVCQRAGKQNSKAITFGFSSTLVRLLHVLL